MDQVLVVLPLLVAVVLLSGLVRLAARFTGRISVSWKHAVVYAVITVLANAGIRMAVVASGVPLPALVFPVSSLLFQLVLGALYFAQRAKTVDGKAIGASGGAKISGIVFAINTAIAGVFFALAPR